MAESYSEVASEATEERIYGSCCQATKQPSMEEALAKACSIGYSAEDIRKVPTEALALSMGCGNPTKYAHLRPGESVLDVGCGAGLDSILSSKQVGRSGMVLATDLSRRMLQLSRRNSRMANLTNLEFVLCDGENLPLADGSVHHIITNCSTNLMPDKQKALEEAYRVVKENGCVTFSDIMSTVVLPDEYRKDTRLWAACMAGVVTEDSFLQGLRGAGFESVKVVHRRVFHYGEKDRTRIGKFFGGRTDLLSLVFGLENRVETLVVQARRR